MSNMEVVLMKKKISPWLAAAATAVFISITAAGGTKVYADELDNKGETVVSTTQEDNADEDYDTVTPEVENEEVADEVTPEAENEEADTVTPEAENEEADTVTPEVENEEADTVTPEVENEEAADIVTPEVKEEENIVTEAPEVKSDIKDADKSKQEIVKDKETEEVAAVVTNNESEMVKPKGWVKDGDNWKYYFGTGEDQYYKNGIQKVGNESYYFDSVGNMKTGWIKDKDNNCYYFAYNSGRLAQGWVKDNDKWYFLGCYTLNTDEGKWEIAEDAFVMQSNKIMKDYANPSSKANYFFTSSGAMSTGWAKDKEEYWFHSNSQGILDQGWKQIDGKYYYFGCYNDKLGRIIGFDMLRGGREIEGADYYFSESGVMQTGWINGNNYRSAGCVSVANYAYANPSGRLAQGWKQIDNKWYYFATYELDKKSYHMFLNNIYLIDDKYYRFDKDGAMICQVGTDLQDME